MSRRARLTAVATADLEAIAAYHAERSLPYARQVVQKLREAFRLVGRFPGLGSPADDLSPGLRRRPAGDYVVFFRRTPTGTEIVRVIHGSRDIGPGDFPSE
jgi:plasmid stabilization system protein ParE